MMFSKLAAALTAAAALLTISPRVYAADAGTPDIICSQESSGAAASKSYETRITVLDSETGEPIPDEILKCHPYTLGTDIRFRSSSSPDGWMSTGPVYLVDAAPYVVIDDLASLANSADYFKLLGKGRKSMRRNDDGSLDITIRTKLTVSGDANGDGSFAVSDVVGVQKWLSGYEGAELVSWKEADFCMDTRLDILDLCMMRQALIEKTTPPVSVSLHQGGGVAGVNFEYGAYAEDGRYYATFTNRHSRDGEPSVIEITAEEYNDLMSVDYAGIIDADGGVDDDDLLIVDGFYFRSELTYVNGSVVVSGIEFREAMMKIEDMFSRREIYPSKY